MLILLSQMELSAENQGGCQPTAKPESSLISQCNRNGESEGASLTEANLLFFPAPQMDPLGGGRGLGTNRLPCSLASSAALRSAQIWCIEPKQYSEYKLNFQAASIQMDNDKGRVSPPCSSNGPQSQRLLKGRS